MKRLDAWDIHQLNRSEFRRQHIADLMDVLQKQAQEEFGGVAYVDVSVHRSHAFDTVDWPIHTHASGTSWRTYVPALHQKFTIFAPPPNPYETLPDEWLMLDRSLSGRWYTTRNGR